MASARGTAIRKMNPVSQAEDIAQGPGTQVRRNRAVFGHSLGLTILSLTGMWEVFAIVGLRAVLIFYLVQTLRYSESSAIQIYSQSTAACALMGLVGGYAADRYFGVRRSVIAGALLMSVGNLLLIVPSTLYAGLSILAIGNGLLRPTLLAEVGALYAPDDPRRDSAFTVYKVACNLGAFLAPLICGAVGAIYGWRWAFAASSVAMLVATGVFVGASPLLGSNEGSTAKRQPRQGAEMPAQNVLAIVAITWVSAVLFWTAYKQIETTVPLWTERNVERWIHIAGWSVRFPSAMLQSVNPLMIFAFAPVVTWLWSRSAKRSGVREGLRRMAFGGVLLAVTYVMLAIEAQATPTRASAVWLVLSIAPLSLGELYLDPVGEALYSRVTGGRFASLLMAVWFFSAFAAYQFTGFLGRVWVSVPASTYFWGTAVVALLSVPLMVFASRLAGTEPGDCAASAVGG